jgi:hypothetical protein
MNTILCSERIIEVEFIGALELKQGAWKWRNFFSLPIHLPSKAKYYLIFNMHKMISLIKIRIRKCVFKESKKKWAE